MKTIIITSIIFLFTASSFAQLYSSGNNNINGNNIGIGTNSPGDRLEIKSNWDPNAPTCISCPPPTPPGVRFQTQFTGAINPTSHYWDMDASDEFSFRYRLNNSTAIQVLRMDEDRLDVFADEALITSNVTINSSASSTADAIIGLGVEYDGATSSWSTTGTNNKGGALLSKSNGTLEFRTGLNASASTDNALVIMHNGNIGIGEDNPNAKLVVKEGNVKVEDGNLDIQEGSLTLGEGDLNIADGRLVVSDGTTNQFEVNKNGYVTAREILVDLSEPIPDYVFDNDYELMSLEDLRSYLDDENHLPNIPSADEYAEMGGLEVGELSRLLLEKQEELTLYILQLEERIHELENNKSE